jgi:hypothetical protein
MKSMQLIGSLITTLFSTLGGLLLITGSCETVEQMVFSFCLMTGGALLTLLILTNETV